MTPATPPDAGSEQALREWAATALERALGFVESHADPVDRVRAFALLQARPADEAADAIAARQTAEGSFPARGALAALSLGFEAPAALSPAEVGGTLEALSALADLRQLHHGCVARAVDFLGACQREDGSWGDAAAAEERLYLTGSLGGFLGRTGSVRPHVLEGAGAFLASLWAPERVEGGRWSSLAAFAHFYTNVHDDLGDEALQWCGRELERGFRTGRFEAVLVVRTLLECDAAALPAFGVDPAELLAALLDQQARDGGFAGLAAGGPQARLAPTLDALRGILALCAIL